MKFLKHAILSVLLLAFIPPVNAAPLLMHRKPGESQAVGAPDYYINWANGIYYVPTGVPNFGVGTSTNLRNASIFQEQYSGANANIIYTRACGSAPLTKVTTMYSIRISAGCGIWNEGTTTCTTGGCVAGGVAVDNTNFVWYNRDWTCAGNCAINAPSNTWTATNATVAKDQTGADGAANAATSVTATSSGGKVCAPVPIPPFNAALASAGVETGYVVNEIITLNDSCATHTKIKVLTSVGTHVTTFNLNALGSCATLPTNPVSQLSTTGSGVGATFNLSFNKMPQSAYIKRITGTGGVSLSPDDSTYTDFSGSINSSTYTRASIAPVVAPATPLFCLKLATSGDKVAVDFAQMVNSNAGDISALLTTNGTILLGDEMPSFNTPSGSPVMQNAGYRILEDIYQGKPTSIMITYSGNFSPTLSHLLFGTDGASSVIPFATGAAGGGVVTLSAPGSGTLVSTGTDVSGLGTINKALFSCYGGGCKICVNGVGPDKSTTIHAQYTYNDANLTHAGQLNNGSSLVPTNGYESVFYGWRREVTDLECQLYTSPNFSFLEQ